MNIAELFVKIGLTGENKVLKGLKGVNENLKLSASSAFAFKAALVGAFFGAERLTAWASKQGLALQTFAATTGLSTDALQDWQYALNKFDVSAGETQNTIAGIQDAMTNMLVTGEAPQFMSLLGLTEADTKDAFKVMEKLQKYVKTAPDPRWAKLVASKFGLSDTMVKGLKMMSMERDRPRPAQKLSEDEIANLAKIRGKWNEMWWNIERLGQKFVGQYGNDIVGIINLWTKGISDFAGWFIKLWKTSESFRGIMTAIGAIILAWAAPVLAVVAAITYALNEYKKFTEGKGNVFSSIGEKAGAGMDWIKNAAGGLFSGNDALKNTSGVVAGQGLVKPGLLGGPGGQGATVQNNVYLNGEKLHSDSLDTTKKSIKSTYRLLKEYPNPLALEGAR